MAYFDINKLKIRFMVKYPRFKYILNELPIELDYKINTACTDGEKLYFNPTFMESLDEEQQLFVFAHEVLHVALNHIDRCLDKNPYYWNLATDAVINDYLKSNGLKFVDGCVDIAGALNHTAEEMYEKLKKEDEEKKEDTPQNIKNSDKRGNGKPTDTKSSSNDNHEEDNKDKTKENGSSNKDNNEEEKKRKNNVGHDSHERWKKAAEKHKKEGKENPKQINENNEFSNNDNEKKQNDDNYLTNGIAKNGNEKKDYGAGNRRVNPKNITENPETLDWRTLLIQNTRTNPDWDIRYGEVENGVVVPTFIEEEYSNCEIVIDTSASISEELIRNFLHECLSIINSSNTKVGFFDTKFYGFNDIRDEDDINNLSIDGGGGTNFNAAVEAFSENCENKIIFTDGLSLMPNKEIDAIWVVFGYQKHEIHPKGGKVIYITGDDYENLCSQKKSKKR